MRHDNPNRKDDYLMSSHQNTKYADGDWFVCVPVTQKVQNFWMADFDVQKFSRQSAWIFATYLLKASNRECKKCTSTYIFFCSFSFNSDPDHMETFQTIRKLYTTSENFPARFQGWHTKTLWMRKKFPGGIPAVTQVFGRLVWSPDHLYGKSSRTYFCILYSEK